jgi:DedD protein
VNSLVDNTDEEEDLPLRARTRRNNGQDREITLGTTMILLIFFALAVYGAMLFGFGYSLGSKHTGANSGAVASASGSSATFSGVKPSPGNPVGSASSPKAPVVHNNPVPYTPPAPAKTVPLPSTSSEGTTLDGSEPKPRPTPPAPAPPPVSPPAAGISPPAGPPIVVQVAAVSHREDAELIASTLQRRGYTVVILVEPDRLFHVQVGPFYVRKEADAMKARLLADGFNAYIK